MNRIEVRHHRVGSRAAFADTSTRRTINGGSVPPASVRFRRWSERSFSHFATRRNSSSRSFVESSRGSTIAMPIIAPSACSCPTNGSATNATWGCCVGPHFECPESVAGDACLHFHLFPARDKHDIPAKRFRAADKIDAVYGPPSATISPLAPGIARFAVRKFLDWCCHGKYPCVVTEEYRN